MSEPSGRTATGAGRFDAARGDERFVRIVDVVKKFGATTAVNHVSLDIAKGEIFALLGSSGCGKSTLLRMLAGLEPLTDGHILIDGEDMALLPPFRRPTNMMFQSYALFPHMTVEANVGFGLRQEGVGRAAERERVGAALALVQMERFAKRKPQQLSGGQQQRVALARSLIKRPKLLLLDEPMSALDKQIRQQTQIELVNILTQVGVTCIMVTHDQEEAMTMASRLAVMSEGRILQVGTPHEIYEFPNSRFTAEFIGSTNLFPGVLEEDEPDHILVSSPDLEERLYISHGVTGPQGMQLSISVRPERVTVSRTPPAQAVNSARGTVENVAYMGAYSLLHVKLRSGKTVLANVARAALVADGEPVRGEAVFVSWTPESGVVLTQSRGLFARTGWSGRTAVIAAPYAWLLLFFFLPFLLVLKISFADLRLGVPPYTELATLRDGVLNVTLRFSHYVFLLTDSLYFAAYVDSIKVAAVSTLFCLLLGYPMAYYIARSAPARRNLLLMAVMLPFWTSLLIRVYAWIGILKNNGLLNQVLLSLGVIHAPLELYHTNTAVYIGMVYSYLPFLVMPLYAHLVKMDLTLLEAAYDLGARPLTAFLRITLPLSRNGVVAGCLLVFIPAVGEYVIPELLGGADTLMIGRVMWNEFFSNADWPMASAVTCAMVLLLLVPMAWFQHAQAREVEGARR